MTHAKMLPGELRFEHRVKHPSLDPVNALLSLGYVLVTNEIAALAESVGFDPLIGFLHGLRYGRQSLPLDLVEEFRQPVVDGLVLTLVNKRSINENDFHKGDDGAFFLNKEAFSRFLEVYEDRLDKPFVERESGSEISYRRLFRRQVENMEKAVLNGQEYEPFLVR